MNKSGEGDLLSWLMDWYASQCDGVWEEHHRIIIESIDNPGWWIKIDLVGSAFEQKAKNKLLRTQGEPPSASNGNVGGSSWLVCQIVDGKFDGAGDPSRLIEIVGEFRRWIQANGP